MPLASCARGYHNLDLPLTIIYLKRPRMTAAFDVSIIRSAETKAEIQGDLEAVQQFLELCDGVPQFDLERAGVLYRQCTLNGEQSTTVMTFSFDWVGEPDVDSQPPN